MVDLDLLRRRLELPCLRGLQKSTVGYIVDALETYVSAHSLNLHQDVPVLVLMVILDSPFVDLLQDLKNSFNPRVVSFEDVGLLALFEYPAHEGHNKFHLL